MLGFCMLSTKRISSTLVFNCFWPAAGLCCSGLLSNLAIPLVGYRSKLLVKSCKPFFILIVLILSGKYNFKKLAQFISLVLAGIGLIIYFYNNETHNQVFEYLGLGYLILSLFIDSFTSWYQLKTREYNVVETFVATNLWISLFMLFFQSTPPSLDYVYMGMLGSIGQLIIFYFTSTKDPVYCNILTTGRKLVTFVAGSIIFQSELTANQIIGSACIGVAILLY
jgi:drug/metabolite transporter (DMT)-like permease